MSQRPGPPCLERCTGKHGKGDHRGDQLAALVCTIGMINTYNRLNVICGNQGGDYQPGQWG